MSAYSSVTYHYGNAMNTGVLLVNLGTPSAPTPTALRRYLGEFLADPRITEKPRWLWWLILHGIILRVRPRRAAKKYQQIWTEQGSPLLVISRAQLQLIRQGLEQAGQSKVVSLGMRYGYPSIANALEELQQARVGRVLVLPLYPQYSGSTTGSTFDEVTRMLQTWRWVPELRFINSYAGHPSYIQALTSSIQERWREFGKPNKLLFSFHGIPKRFSDAGDPYRYECEKTAKLVAAELQLSSEHWQVVFQSRFGPEEWLQPYTDKTLIELAQQGVSKIDIIAPGFAADCLETLEEIAVENQQLFLQFGGEQLNYIPALNNSPKHIQALLALIAEHDWKE